MSIQNFNIYFTQHKKAKGFYKTGTKLYKRYFNKTFVYHLLLRVTISAWAVRSIYSYTATHTTTN